MFTQRLAHRRQRRFVQHRNQRVDGWEMAHNHHDERLEKQTLWVYTGASSPGGGGREGQVVNQAEQLHEQGYGALRYHEAVSYLKGFDTSCYETSHVSLLLVWLPFMTTPQFIRA
jgi:hypothetical protein